MDDNQDTSQTAFVSSPFDALRHEEDGREYWLARELSKILGYSLWQNFEKVIAKAKIACVLWRKERWDEEISPRIDLLPAKTTRVIASASRWSVSGAR